MAVRHVIHTVISIMMWFLFGYYWYLVTARGFSRSSLEALGILSAIITVGLVLTFWWVSHNVRLARRDRRQEAPTRPGETLARDYLHRPITGADMNQLRQAQVVEIAIDEKDNKIYSIPGNEGR